jgi:hypothetical protein
VDAENEAYLVESPWMNTIRSYLDAYRGVDAITTEKLLSDAISKPVERQTRADQMQVASILRELGYERHREAKGGSRRWIYRIALP